MSYHQHEYNIIESYRTMICFNDCSVPSRSLTHSPLNSQLRDQLIHFDAYGYSVFFAQKIKIRPTNVFKKQKLFNFAFQNLYYIKF